MDDRELVSERDDFQVQHGARPDQEAKGVKERDDDGRHDCRLSENACNLNRRNTYEVLGRDSRGSGDFHPENARDGMKPQREAFHYASFCSILLWDITRVRGSGRRNSHWLYGA